MVNEVLALIVDESKWLTASLGVALLAVAFMSIRIRSAAPLRQKAVAAMSLFFALTVGTMAFGHLLAVSVKLALGTLEGSIAKLYLIGVALAVPSWWLVAHAARQPTVSVPHRFMTLRLNAWVVATLLLIGIHNIPLAAPGFVNIAYVMQSRRALGWVLVSLFVAINVALLVGSLVFLASGQTFEQFRGVAISTTIRMWTASMSAW
jgi:hypothetical protein